VASALLYLYLQLHRCLYLYLLNRTHFKCMMCEASKAFSMTRHLDDTLEGKIVQIINHR